MLIDYYSPDEYVYHEIIDPKEFWCCFDSLEEWSQKEDYLDYVTDGVALPSYIFDGKATALHVVVVE